MPIVSCATQSEYNDFASKNDAFTAYRSAIEASLVQPSDSFLVPGFCAVCRRPADFLVDFAASYLPSIPNWRERLVCPYCKLNNRMRLSLHFIEEFESGAAELDIYITEQATPLYSWFKKLYPKTVGSEFLSDGTVLGKVNSGGIRKEDLTRLSFGPESFDLVCTFDVLEHVPDYESAARECVRCLKVGGGLLVTVPFDLNSETTSVRARVRPDGSVEHLAPPEYHGDPLSEQGVLCFQTFGWDFLALLRRVGLSDAAVHFAWSDKYGYLGGLQSLIFGRKAAAP